MQPYATLVSALTLSTAMLFAAIAAPASAAEVDVSKCPANKTWQDAYNKGDTAAVAALYAADAIEVTPGGIRIGPAAVKERLEGQKKAGDKNTVITAAKCNIEGSTRWSAGDWKSEPPQGPVSGFRTAIEAKDGNTWKMVSLTWNVTMPPPPPANK
jgi:ketosteroid isomerase-like protein